MAPLPILHGADTQQRHPHLADRAASVLRSLSYVLRGREESQAMICVTHWSNHYWCEHWEALWYSMLGPHQRVYYLR